jgi:hypothetical protein
MARPDIATLACLNPQCQQFDQPDEGNVTVRKVYGQDHICLLRCTQSKEEFSERRATPLSNTKISEAKATSVIEHLGEGCGIRPIPRLLKGSKDTVAPLLQTSCPEVP